jgi:hypothetical protein
MNCLTPRTALAVPRGEVSDPKGGEGWGDPEVGLLPDQASRPSGAGGRTTIQPSIRCAAPTRPPDSGFARTAR